MFQPHRAVLTRREKAPTLGNNYPSFLARQIVFRKGGVSMIAGPPGSGKSSLALAIAVRAQVPTLYLSADTTRETVNMRLIAMLTGLTVNEAEDAIASDPEWASQILAQAGHIWVEDDSAPSLETIERLLDAFREAEGREPELIVIDNATDVVVDGMDEYGSLRALMRDLRYYGRETGAAVIALHHTRLGMGNPAPPSDSVHGKITQVPELVLTMTSDAQPGFIGVSPVKNRHGSPDPYGTNPVWLEFDASRSRINDMMEAPVERAV